MNYIKPIAICAILIAVLILPSGCQPLPIQSNLIPAKVTRVVSGQSLEVVLAGTSAVVQVRIIGIDAPDLRQFPWGKTAKQKLSQLVMGKAIALEMETKGQEPDRFNRLQAHLWQDKTLISQELVQAGCVLANTRYNHPYSKLLIDAQEYARLMGQGIWNPKQAMRYTPNQFRSNLKQ